LAPQLLSPYGYWFALAPVSEWSLAVFTGRFAQVGAYVAAIRLAIRGK